MTTGGALAGERGTGAHQLGRGRVLCGACAGDIGRGGSVRGTEPRAELVGTHAAELTEPMLGLDLGDVRRLLERLGGRSTAGLRRRRRRGPPSAGTASTSGASWSLSASCCAAGSIDGCLSASADPGRCAAVECVAS